MLAAADTRSLALLYHLNSEPWLSAEAESDQAYQLEFKEMRGAEAAVALPATSERGGLLELLGRRGSCREFAAGSLPLAVLAEILAGSYGLGRTLEFPGGLETRARSVPSAGALYPLELYLLLRQVETVADGVYHYNVLDHALERLQAELDPLAFAEAVIAAPLLENANVLVVMGAVFDRTLHKYGARGYRYILLEAGHVAQNLCLLAAERGLASLCVGGFRDAALNRLLALEPPTEAAVYCVGIGHPAEESAAGTPVAGGETLA
jgi:SagB-type dehydrogenase family enzyme